jgi:hypothetical protein
VYTFFNKQAADQTEDTAVRAFRARSDVMGNCSTAASVASYTVVAGTPPMQPIAGPPPPLGDRSGGGTMMVSILGRQEKRGMAKVSKIYSPLD